MTARSGQPRYSFVFEPDEERADYVTNRLREFNQTGQSPLWSNFSQPAAPLQIYALDEHGVVIGGLIGETNGIPEWLNISVIWITEEQRGQGLGRQLMSMAEEEAKRRRCRYARLASSDFQAPGFYQAIGYKIYGKLENCPQGETVYYFHKELT